MVIMVLNDQRAVEELNQTERPLATLCEIAS